MDSSKLLVPFVPAGPGLGQDSEAELWVTEAKLQREGGVLIICTLEPPGSLDFPLQTGGAEDVHAAVSLTNPEGACEARGGMRAGGLVSLPTSAIRLGLCSASQISLFFCKKKKKIVLLPTRTRLSL